MIVLTNTTEQTLNPGQSLVFDDVVLSTECGACHRRNSSIARMCASGIYELSYGANIGGPTAATPVQLSLTVGGATLAETTAISVPAAIADRNNVSRETRYSKCCCGGSDQVSLTNTGVNPVIVAPNAVLVIDRED